MSKPTKEELKKKLEAKKKAGDKGKIVKK